MPQGKRLILQLKTNQTHQMQVFFIRNKLDNGDLEVVYCPTEIVWADVLTKPKQGGPFRLDRSILGMVQAWVGQKPLKRDILRLFL